MPKQKVQQVNPITVPAFSRELPDADKKAILTKAATELKLLFDDYFTPMSREVRKEEYDAAIEAFATKLKEITGPNWELQTCTMKAKDNTGNRRDNYDTLRIRLQCWDAILDDMGTQMAASQSMGVHIEPAQLTCSIKRFELQKIKK